MSDAIPLDVFRSLCAAAAGRSNFTDALMFSTMFNLASRAEDSKQLALEDFNITADDEPGVGLSFVTPFSMKTFTSKSVSVVARYDGSDACWITSFGDAASTGHFNSLRTNDTPFKTFLFPAIAIKSDVSEYIIEAIRQYMKPYLGASTSTVSGEFIGPVRGLTERMTSHAFRRAVASLLHRLGCPMSKIVAITGHAVSSDGVGASNTVWDYIDLEAILSSSASAKLNGYPVDVTVPHYATPVSPSVAALLKDHDADFFERLLDIHFKVVPSRTPCLAANGEQRFLLRTALACHIMWYSDRRKRFGNHFPPVKSLNRALMEAGVNSTAVERDQILDAMGVQVRSHFVATNEPMRHPPGSDDLLAVAGLLSTVACTVDAIAARMEKVERSVSVEGGGVIGLLQTLISRVDELGERIGAMELRSGGSAARRASVGALHASTTITPALATTVAAAAVTTITASASTVVAATTATTVAAATTVEGATHDAQSAVTTDVDGTLRHGSIPPPTINVAASPRRTASVAPRTSTTVPHPSADILPHTVTTSHSAGASVVATSSEGGAGTSSSFSLLPVPDSRDTLQVDASTPFSVIFVEMLRAKVKPEQGTRYLLAGSRAALSRLQSGFLRWQANITITMRKAFAALWKAERYDAELIARALQFGEVLDKVLLYRLLHLRIQKQQRALPAVAMVKFSYETALGKATASAVDTIVSELVANESFVAADILKRELLRPLSQSLLQAFADQLRNPIIRDYASAALNERAAAVAAAAATAAAHPTSAAAAAAAAHPTSAAAPRLPVSVAAMSPYDLIASGPKRRREEKMTMATKKSEEEERVLAVRAKVGDGVAATAMKHASKGRAPSVAGTGGASAGGASGFIGLAASMLGLG
jgi:hypothetical protein